MTKKPKKTVGVLEIIRQAEENYFNSVLETVLTDYEPQNKLLASALESREKTAIEMLKGKDLKYNTDPKNLVQWYLKNSRNPDEYDIGPFLINLWVHCKRIRHYLKKDDAELAVLSALDLSREYIRSHEFLAENEKKIKRIRNQLRTMPAQNAKTRKRTERLGLLIAILKSKRFTPKSIDRKRNEKMRVFDLLNEALEKRGKAEIKEGQFHIDLKYLREYAPDEFCQSN